MFDGSRQSFPRFWCAPMVGASELAFRMTVRRLGATCAHTPMIDAAGFSANPKYRTEFRFDAADDPAVAQVCGNRPAALVAAARLLQEEPGIRAVEINLGCPQRCARRGNYGAFLARDAPDAVADLVRAMAGACRLPVFAKMRVLEEEAGGAAATVAFARQLEAAGAALLTVHGRTLRDEPLADWRVVRAVKRAVNIPVVANGNVRGIGDVWRCFEATGADAVMSACGLLKDPALFQRGHAPALDEAELVAGETWHMGGRGSGSGSGTGSGSGSGDDGGGGGGGGGAQDGKGDGAAAMPAAALAAAGKSDELGEEAGAGGAVGAVGGGPGRCAGHEHGRLRAARLAALRVAELYAANAAAYGATDTQVARHLTAILRMSLVRHPGLRAPIVDYRVDAKRRNGRTEADLPAFRALCGAIRELREREEREAEVATAAAAAAAAAAGDRRCNSLALA